MPAEDSRRRRLRHALRHMTTVNHHLVVNISVCTRLQIMGTSSSPLVGLHEFCASSTQSLEETVFFHFRNGSPCTTARFLDLGSSSDTEARSTMLSVVFRLTNDTFSCVPTQIASRNTVECRYHMMPALWSTDTNLINRRCHAIADVRWRLTGTR